MNTVHLTVEQATRYAAKLSDNSLDNWLGDIQERHAEGRMGHNDDMLFEVISAEIQDRFLGELDEWNNSDNPHADFYWIRPHVTDDDIPF